MAMNHYELLGVNPGASEGQIAAAFRKLAKVYHPDHGGNGELFARLVSARAAALRDLNSSSPHTSSIARPVSRRSAPPPQVKPATVFHVGQSPFNPPSPLGTLFRAFRF